MRISMFSLAGLLALIAFVGMLTELSEARELDLDLDFDIRDILGAAELGGGGKGSRKGLSKRDKKPSFMSVLMDVLADKKPDDVKKLLDMVGLPGEELVALLPDAIDEVIDYGKKEAFRTRRPENTRPLVSLFW